MKLDGEAGLVPRPWHHLWRRDVRAGITCPIPLNWPGPWHCARYLNNEGIEGRQRVTAQTGTGHPIRADVLSRALIRPGGLWQQIRVVEVTGSTNADLLAEAVAGAAGGRVLVAEAQTAGRGRLGRHWVSPPRGSLAFSVLLPAHDLPPARRAWIPLLAGVAAASALRSAAAVDAWLKWPNDVLVGEAKLAGILAEQHRDAVVVGVGINVTLGRPDLPVPSATSLLLENAAVLDRTELLGVVLRELERWYRAEAAAGDADESGLRSEYLGRCATIGRQVRVELPGGHALTGIAADVDGGGRLVVRTASGLIPVSAGDVVHVR